MFFYNSNCNNKLKKIVDKTQNYDLFISLTAAAADYNYFKPKDFQ